MTNKNFDNNDPSFRPEAAVGTEETPGTPGASESRENKNLLSPRGRIGRWTFALVWITATILNTFLIELSNIFVEPNEAMILLAVIVAVGLVSVFAAIKRCRDRDRLGHAGVPAALQLPALFLFGMEAREGCGEVRAVRTTGNADGEPSRQGRAHG